MTDFSEAKGKICFLFILNFYNIQSKNAVQ